MNFTEQLEAKYPTHIIEYLRQREGLDESDNSKDEMFLNMTKGEVFREVLNWNGLLGSWDYTIKDWIEGIYKVDLDDFEENE